MLKTTMTDLFQLQSLQNQWNKQFCKDSYYSLACLKLDEQIKEVKKRIKESKLAYPIYIES